MRALTNEERELLVMATPPHPSNPPEATARMHIIAQGLISDRFARFEWVRTYDDGERWVEHLFLERTSAGERALRIDDAFRRKT